MWIRWWVPVMNLWFISLFVPTDHCICVFAFCITLQLPTTRFTLLCQHDYFNWLLYYLCLRSMNTGFIVLLVFIVFIVLLVYLLYCIVLLVYYIYWLYYLCLRIIVLLVLIVLYWITCVLILLYCNACVLLTLIVLLEPPH